MTLSWPSVPYALSPRRAGERCTRVEALRLLEAERSICAALAVRAIAEGWDNGRLGSGTTDELPREREVLGLLGVRQGIASQRVAEASETLADVMNDARQLADSITSLKPIDELVEEFGLSSLARMILVLVAAPQMWGEVAQLYAVVANNPTRDVVDEHLLRQLLGPRVNPHDLAHELSPTEPLMRFGLVQTTSSAPRPFTGLAPNPLVLSRLRADPLEVDPMGELDIVTGAKPLDELRLPDAIAERLKLAIARQPTKPLRLVVRGREGSGRRTLLASLAQLANRRLAMIHMNQLGDRAPAATDLRRALDRCALAGWIPCIDGLASLPAEDRSLRDKLRRVIGDFLGPLAIRLERDAQAPIEAGYLQIDLPDLSETERLEVWRHALAEHGIEAAASADTLAPLAARWKIGPGTIHRVVAHVSEGGIANLSSATVDQAVSQHLERRLGDVAEKVKYLPRLADMVLPGDILDSLTEFLSRMRLHRTVFEEWGMTRVASTGRGITALFQGPPGTGKTMVAGALARELGIELYRVDLSRVMSKWIGETEKNLGNVFSAAEEGQAIILFDEADSLFTKRTEVKSSNDRYANLEVNYLLQRIDSFTGIAILTTNFGTSIDSAFKRRLAFRIHFPIPDEEQREQLWRSHLPPSLPTQGDLDLSDLARKYPLTGGSVRNCVMRAAFLAAAENTKLGQDHLLRAVRLEYRAAGKLSESGPLE
ncbi:MAG TPA: ATP-binding protein [Kofleriaceae bacterium]|nr:ATP-binding protein [Kofleriaceae bacterium]